MGNELFKNIPSKVGDLVKDVRNGRIGLPDLQRPFVWRDNKVRELFDSMLKGYPIGYIMLWESPVDYESKKSAIGDNSKTYAFESFLADFAVRKGVSLSGRNGILQKRDALSAHISKKHRGMIEFVGQVRNAADHGADPDENNQVWTISNETARIYPCIIAALIKAIFSRDDTGSIEV